MVIPMSMPRFSGEMPQEVQKHLSILKYFVITMYLCAFVRMLWDPFGALNDIFCALFGTFLLKDDSTLRGCYGCLMSSPLAMFGDGGISCLVPFSLICMFNGVMNIIKALMVVGQVGLLPCVNGLGCFVPIIQMTVSIAELGACYLGWRIFAKLQSGTAGYDDPEAAAGRTQGAAGFFGPNRRDDPPAAAQQPFVPFAGQGNRLGI
eukprot:GEMP01050658.1.p1 GENE.GEMP01050658.1~~GEMP01050658.1.p1  ORF type:complete len:239 (+),score=21.27 GEMP01050658.1:102-719(+)